MNDDGLRKAITDSGRAAESAQSFAPHSVGMSRSGNDDRGPSSTAPRHRDVVTPGPGWSDVAEGLIAASSVVGRVESRVPFPQGRPDEVLKEATKLLGKAEIPEVGIGSELALSRLGLILHRYGVDLSHEKVVAHLQPPPLTVAVAADALASASNASLDTYDSGPGTIAVERWVIKVLRRLARFGEGSDGVFTPGGSQSNLLALLIARDLAATQRGADVRSDGVAALGNPKIFASNVAHFSLNRACATLGLGERAMVAIDTDAGNRMRPEVLDRALSRLDDASTPIAIVATAGTTDFGSIDPIEEIADVAEHHGVWLHVDAAYGFGAMFSTALSPLLRGLERANSVTLDLHKIGWQPAAASVLLLAQTDHFSPFSRSVPYLNPTDDEDAGFGGLLGYSLQTTRRPDAVKVAASLLTHGRTGLGAMLETCHRLAQHAEARIRAEAKLELVSPATLTTVVFRFMSEGDSNKVNAELRRKLLTSGEAVIGRTSVEAAGGFPGRTCLKLTLLNPLAREMSIDRVIDDVVRVGTQIEDALRPGPAS